MRNLVLCCGLLGVWAVSSPLANVAAPVLDPASQLPAWLAMPATAEIMEMSFNGGLGEEMREGSVSALIYEDSRTIATRLKTRLALQGFMIEERATDLDRSTGAASVFEAANPLDGRTVTAVALDTPSGGLLRIDFSNPAAPAMTTDF
jgi:hypothetical protein